MGWRRRIIRRGPRSRREGKFGWGKGERERGKEKLVMMMVWSSFFFDGVFSRLSSTDWSVSVEGIGKGGTNKVYMYFSRLFLFSKNGKERFFFVVLI